jgi:hypothetical protein
MDLALRRGVIIRGQVIEEGTGRPVQDVGVLYAPRWGNPHVGDDDDVRSHALTDAQGRFTLTGVPGPGVILAEASSDYIRHSPSPVDFTYESNLRVHGLVRLEIPTGNNVPDVIVKLKKGVTLEARATNPAGATFESIRAWCPELKSRLDHTWFSLAKFPGGRFRLPGAEPGRTYRVFMIDSALRFAAVATLKADPDRKAPIEVVLEPTAAVRGRVLDVDGKPIEGAQILLKIQYADPGSEFIEKDLVRDAGSGYYSQVTNEPINRFYPAEFDYKGLIPGVRYIVMWYPGKGESAWRVVEPLKPGEERDLGDLRSEVKKGGENGE